MEALRGFAKTISADFGIKKGIEFWDEAHIAKVKEKWKAWAKIISTTPHLVNKSLEELNRFKKSEISNILKNGTYQRSTGEKPRAEANPAGGYGFNESH